MEWLQPVPRYVYIIIYGLNEHKQTYYRGTASWYGDESPPLQNQNIVKQQNPTSNGLGYGEYDYLYQNSPVSIF